MRKPAVVSLSKTADAKTPCRVNLTKTVALLGDVKGFTGYRKMLREVKSELVSVGPRWLDQHRDMVIAAAKSGVRGIYLEKPMCRDLAEADEMVAACERHGTKLAIATQTRYSPQVKIIKDMIESGQLGRIVEYRIRGKDDRRGGGEDLWVLGTHVLDQMRHFGGDAQSCFATVLQNGRPVTAANVKEGNEGIARDLAFSPDGKRIVGFAGFESI